MDITDSSKADWKHKIGHELIQYGLIFMYLAFFFSVFTWYRRLILAEYHIYYLHYGISIFKALILAKVVLLGGTLGLGRQTPGRPLVISTLVNTIIFCLWVAAFDLLERTIIGLLHGRGLAGGVQEILHVGADELLVRCVLTFFAFIPFFAFKALAQELGETRIRELFFRQHGVRKTPADESA